MDPQALFGPITTHSHRIDDFATFILNNVPYGVVQPRNIQWGALQFDGPAVFGIDGAKPVLQWHFGGVPYPITKAICIHYTYIRTFDGSNAPITDLIFIGLQEHLPGLIRPQPIPFVATPSLTFQARVNGLGPFGGFSNPAWASDASVLASEANGVITRSYQYDPANPNLLNTVIQNEFTEDQTRFDTLTEGLTAIDFDGPAQDSDSHHIFPYTFETLVNDPYKYGQLLFWYFAGKPYRVTKAMRIPLNYTPDAEQPSLVLRAAAAKATSVQSRGAIESLDVSDIPTAVDPVPQGHALFIGFAGAGDPGG